MLAATTIASRVRAGDLDPLEVTEQALGRLDQRDRHVRAFLDADREYALERAAEVSEQVARGEDPGRLAGVPIALKDNIAVRGRQLTAGSRILEGYRAPYHAHVVERLLDEGAVLLGRTNLDEFAMGASTENSGFEPSRNPWDLWLVPGGSSGGSAAAVGAGIVPLALGSETGGSIRQPASFCGVTGYKPTFGHVSRYGLVAFGSSLDQIGPLAAHAEDAALLYDVIAHHDPRDSTCVEGERPSACREPADLEGVRIAFPEDFAGKAVDPHVVQLIASAMDVLADAGAVTRVLPAGRMRHAPLAIPVYYLVSSSEASSNLARFDGMRYGPREEAEDMIATYFATRSKHFGPEVQRRILLGTFALSEGYRDAWYDKALRVRRLLRDEYTALFEEFDLIAHPTTPTAAFRAGERLEDPYQMYLCDLLTAPACLAGLPSASVPCGTGRRGPCKGLPVGLCLTGPAGADHRVLAAARAFEAARGEPERSVLYQGLEP